MTGPGLAQWRERHGMTQEEAARWIGVAPRTWTRYESDGPPMVLTLLCTAIDYPGLYTSPCLKQSAFAPTLPPATDGSAAS
jgi:DNA-binding XRE family transcriptional regulator